MILPISHSYSCNINIWICISIMALQVFCHLRLPVVLCASCSNATWVTKWILDGLRLIPCVNQSGRATLAIAIQYRRVHIHQTGQENHIERKSLIQTLNQFQSDHAKSNPNKSDLTFHHHCGLFCVVILHFFSRLLFLCWKKEALLCYLLQAYDTGVFDRWWHPPVWKEQLLLLHAQSHHLFLWILIVHERCGQ